MMLESGTGSGKLVEVDNDNRLATTAFTIPLEHQLAKGKQKVFSVFGEITPVAGTTGVLRIDNDNISDFIAISEISVEAPALSGGTALPNSLNYLVVETSSEYISGGTAKMPVNTTSGSPVLSGATCIENGFTSTGEILKKYYAGSGVFLADEDKSILLPPGKGIAFKWVGDNTSGVVNVTCRFATISSESFSG